MIKGAGRATRGTVSPVDLLSHLPVDGGHRRRTAGNDYMTEIIFEVVGTGGPAASGQLADDDRGWRTLARQGRRGAIAHRQAA